MQSPVEIQILATAKQKPVSIPHRFLRTVNYDLNSSSFRTLSLYHGVISAPFYLPIDLNLMDLSNVVITSNDGSMSMTLDPVPSGQSRREELSLIGSQFWFLLFESIPHIYVLSLGTIS
ncbi:hypothetical protein B0F90DRAFT_1819986 [Multifurca ochricompacta]|uniref:Uncharacterized protein n=1 Tax=Multifurca ochricompacta TaxID=376703 RepID=A0AAD4QIQ5_9AGAM|nr:hypothetical protein B0F90DRAFT_1819986 [Multifurca ochricompacta]